MKRQHFVFLTFCFTIFMNFSLRYIGRREHCHHFKCTLKLVDSIRMRQSNVVLSIVYKLCCFLVPGRWLWCDTMTLNTALIDDGVKRKIYVTDGKLLGLLHTNFFLRAANTDVHIVYYQYRKICTRIWCKLLCQIWCKHAPCLPSAKSHRGKLFVCC